MASFKDLLLKIANNARLTPSELDDLGRFGTATEQRNAFVGGNTSAGGALNVPTPFFPIYSEVFQAVTASVTIPIPSGFKHLMILGNGRTTFASAAENIYCRFNADSGANYDHETIYRLNNTSSGNQDLALTAVVVGTFAAGSSDANTSGNLVAFIPNCQSPFFKGATAIGGGYFTAAAGAIVFTDFGQWESTATIQSVTLLPEAGSFAAKTALSVYGIQ